jgi:Fic family protein
MPTFLAVANARAALAALDSTASQLPNPQLLRIPALRLEAQSTSELEGTYAPLADVLTADEEDPQTEELTEILNYVAMATYGFRRAEDGWPLSAALISELQAILMRGTSKQIQSGRLRETQVVIGRRPDAKPGQLPVEAARFVPPPPGPHLEGGVSDLVGWLREDHDGSLDPVMVSGMAHYQFEALHPFMDGNGRVGRFLIVLQLLNSGVIGEPTLTVSPWFEARRSEYYDRLLAVSTQGDWDGFLRFFAQGLAQAATTTRAETLALVSVQGELHEIVRASSLRAGNAHAVVDHAIAHPSFTVRSVETALGVSYPRANKIVSQLVDLDVLSVVDPDAYRRRFYAPKVLRVLTRIGSAS